jgi:hypothetical protein
MLCIEPPFLGTLQLEGYLKLNPKLLSLYVLVVTAVGADAELPDPQPTRATASANREMEMRKAASRAGKTRRETAESSGGGPPAGGP